MGAGRLVPTLLREDAGQGEHGLREVFDGLRHVMKTRGTVAVDAPRSATLGSRLPASAALANGGGFEQLADESRTLPRLVTGPNPEPSAAILDGRTLRSMPESGARAGYDEAKRKKSSMIRLAVETLGHLLALRVTPADADDCAQVGRLAEAMQATKLQS